MAFEVTYDQNDKVEKALPPSAGTQTSKLLISYSQSDGEFVDALEAKLTATGVVFHGTLTIRKRPSAFPTGRACQLNGVAVLSEHSVNDIVVEDRSREHSEP